MHVSVVGAGALGRVYGVRLAHASVDVSFVVRPARVNETSPFVLEMATHGHRKDELARPVRAAAIPAETDCVLLCVKVDDLGGDLVATLRAAPDVPIVALTPLLPHDFDDLARATGRTVIVAQPGVVAYLDARGVDRYWVPRTAPTLVDADAPAEATMPLVDALTRAGLPARREPGVRTSNPATTITFFPLVLALDAAGGTVDGVLADKALTRDAFAAVKEAERLAAHVGVPAPWAHRLMRFVTPLSLRVGLRIARATAPEAVRFVEEHFGKKVRAQNLAMGREIVALFRAEREACPALERLLARASEQR